MARLIYSRKDRYLLTASVRRDGYSAFGNQNPRATFASVAGGWVFSEEPFFNSSWLNYGKIRMSWGSNGNRDLHRSEEHTSELQSLMRISYAVFCLTKNKRT